MEERLDMKLTRFDYGKSPVRTTTIKGEVWFVASDLCATLGIDNNRRATSRLDPDEKGVHSMNTPGGVQKVIMVNESGFYHLMFTSRKPEAATLRRWVTMEVLPQIRKTGIYSARQQELPLAVERTMAPPLQKGVHNVNTPAKQEPDESGKAACELLVDYVCPHVNWLDARLAAVERSLQIEVKETYAEFRKRTC